MNRNKTIICAIIFTTTLFPTLLSPKPNKRPQIKFETNTMQLNFEDCINFVKFIQKYFDKVSTDKNKIILLIRGHDHKLPKRINHNDRIGSTPTDKNIITLVSGIYNTLELNFEWCNLNYYPTFLELIPPNEKYHKWKIQIKYIQNGKEKTDTNLNNSVFLPSDE